MLVCPSVGWLVSQLICLWSVSLLAVTFVPQSVYRSVSPISHLVFRSILDIGWYVSWSVGHWLDCRSVGQSVFLFVGSLVVYLSIHVAVDWLVSWYHGKAVPYFVPCSVPPSVCQPLTLSLRQSFFPLFQSICPSVSSLTSLGLSLGWFVSLSFH